MWDLNVANALTISGINSEISGDLGIGSVGRGGDIKVQSGDISIKDVGVITSSTSGKGDSGNISITARNGISLDLGFVLNDVGSSDAQGNAGKIDITTGSLFLKEGFITSTTSGKGNAGNITIIARDAVNLNSNNAAAIIFSNVNSGAVGNGGKIDIIAGSLSLGNGGIILSGSSGNGNAGDIQITTDQLSFTGGGQLLSSTSGRGNAGSLNINARDTFAIDGTTVNNSHSGIFSSVESDAVGGGGNIDITAGTLSLANNAEVSASSSGIGNSGNVSIATKDAFQ